MVIMDKRNCILWKFTEKPDFSIETQKSNIQGGLTKNEVLGQFADLRGHLAKKKKKWVVFLRGVDTQMNVMRN